jgi:lysophospholipase L1-like esterase
MSKGHVMREAVVLLLSLAIALGIGEGLIRCVYSRRLDYQIEMSRYAEALKRSAQPAEMSHEHIPGKQARLMGVDVSINRHGFRDGDYCLEKPRDTYRILMLGDSLTFGWGVAQGERFSDVLQGMLNASGEADRKVQIVNTGVGNYNTAQEVAFFGARGRGWKPDMVIVNFFINDAEPTPTKQVRWVFRHSYLARWAWGRFDLLQRRFLAAPRYDEYYASLYQENQPGWLACQESIRRLVRMSREDGFALVLAILPELHSVEPQYMFRAVEQKIVERAHEAGVEHVVALSPCFQGHRPQSLWVSPDDAHPNAAGHRIIAEGLYAYLTGERLIPEVAYGQY